MTFYTGIYGGKYHALPLASLLVKRLMNNGVFPPRGKRIDSTFQPFRRSPSPRTSEKRVCAFLNTRPIWIRVSFSSVSLGWLTRQLKTAWMDPASRYQVVSVGHTQPKHGALTRPRFPVTIDTACVNFTHGQEYNYLDNSIAIDGHWNETFRGESTSRGLFIRSKCSVTTFDFTANTSAAATLMLAPPTARLDF